MNLGMESEVLEFKKSTSELEKGVISIASMLNKNGYGTLYFGVKNDGTIIGQKDLNENTLRDVSRKIAEGIEPQIIPTISLELIGELKLIKVEFRGKEQPYSAFGIYYCRSFDEDKKMNLSELKALINKDGEPDRTTYTESDNQDLTFETIKNLYFNHGLTVNDKTFLKNLGFYTADGKYNVLAQLMSDHNETSIKVTTFAGTDKSVILKMNEYGGKCLIISTLNVLDYVESIKETKVKITGKERIEEDTFDFECFREAWLNAVVHNRWVNSAPPAVYIYSDKIEIVSDGGLPTSLSIKDYFEGISKPVNEKMLRIFKDLDLIERTGHGVPKIVEKYGKDIFKISKNTVRIFIPLDKKLLENLDDSIIDLNENEIKVLRLLEENPKYNVKEIIEITKLSKPYIRKIYKNLKEKGYIERIGSNKTGYWKVK